MITVAVIKNATRAGIKHIIILLKSFIIFSLFSLITRTAAIKGKKNATGSQIKQIMGKTKKRSTEEDYLNSLNLKYLKKLEN